MGVSSYDITEIQHGLSAQRVIYRITQLDDNGESIGGRTTDQVLAEAIIGSPEGRALGSPGDLRYRQDIPQIWQKQTGTRTVTGWVLIAGVDAMECFVEQIDNDPTDVIVVSESAFAAIYSVVIPANAMGTDKMVRVRLGGDYLNNSGASRGLALRIRLGATTLLETSFPIIDNIVPNPGRRGAFWEFYLSNRDDTSVQMGGGSFGLGNTFGASVGIGVVAPGGNSLLATIETALFP